MGFSKLNKSWRSDLCKSELLVEQVSMKCICNAFESDQIGVFSDFSRTAGAAVVFPAKEVMEEQSFVVIPTNVDLS